MKFDFKAIYRNLLNNGLYSLLGVAGLLLGFVASCLLFLYVLEQLSYDKNTIGSEPIYKINTHVRLPSSEFTTTTGPAPLAATMQSEIEGVVDSARMKVSKRVVVRVGNNNFFENNIFYADSSLFRFFAYTILSGSVETNLDKPNFIVVTSSMAKKYFGEDSAVGKNIEIDGKLYSVTAVISDPTKKAHFTPRAFISMKSLGEERNSVWASLDDHTYIRLKNDDYKSRVEAMLPAVHGKYSKEIYARFNADVSFSLQPLSDVHFGPRLRETIDASKLGNISDVYLAIFIACIILALASSNYAILAIATSVKRAREVGVRKVLGADRAQLIFQYLFEAVAIVFCLMILSGFIAWLILPFFNSEFMVAIEYKSLLKWEYIVGLFSICLLVGGICAGYPAWYLSGFEPVAVLKSAVTSKKSVAPFKSILLFLQFCLVVFMISSTWIVFSQFNFLKSNDLGFDVKNILKLELSANSSLNQFETLKQQYLQLNSVEGVASATAMPGSNGFNTNSFMIQKENGGYDLKVTKNFKVNHDFAQVSGLRISEGRFFNKDHLTDKDAVVVNRAMVKEFGWTNPIGKRLEKVINQNMDKEYYQVIGVVDDFHMQGLYEKIEPVVMIYSEFNPLILIKLKGAPNPMDISKLTDIWDDVIRNQPFETRFVADDFDGQYQQEKIKGNILALFTGMAVVIAFMGVFGIVSYDIRQKAKELALRVVLGASGSRLMILLSDNFIKIIIVANLISFPLCFYFMTKYLEKFSYHIAIAFPPFLVAGAAVTLITLLTIYWHVTTAVVRDPRASLQEE